MRTRVLVTCAALSLAAACQRPAPAASSGEARYVLHDIGGVAPSPYDTGGACEGRPRSSTWVVGAARWSRVDTLGACPAADRFEPIVLVDSGTVVRRGDTLALTVIGEQPGAGEGVLQAVLRGDTLVLLRPEQNGAIRVYLRRRDQE